MKFSIFLFGLIVGFTIDRLIIKVQFFKCKTKTDTKTFIRNQADNGSVSGQNINAPVNIKNDLKRK